MKREVQYTNTNEDNEEEEPADKKKTQTDFSTVTRAIAQTICYEVLFQRLIRLIISLDSTRDNSSPSM